VLDTEQDKTNIVYFSSDKISRLKWQLDRRQRFEVSFLMHSQDWGAGAVELRHHIRRKPGDLFETETESGKWSKRTTGCRSSFYC